MAGLSDNARALLVALCVERPLVPLAARIAAEDGGRVWLVGGAVRDACLGRPRTDADLACTGDARDLARKIADASGGRFVPLHDDPPTARVVLEGGEHDITTLRAPTIEEDLAARDLALNSLAVAVFDDGLGDLIDPAGGLADIDARLIRTVGAENLRSDPLRALRVYRFAAELDFSIDAATRDWAGIAAAGLSRVAGERVFTEMTRLLETPRAAAAMRLALDDGALAPVAREIVEAGAEATERALAALSVADGWFGCLSAVRGAFEADVIAYLDANAQAGDAVSEKFAALFCALSTDDDGRAPALTALLSRLKAPTRVSRKASATIAHRFESESARVRVDAGGDFARIVASYTAQAGEARLSAPLLAVFESAAGGAHRGALAERVAWLSRLSRFDRDVVRPIENESLVTGHDLTEIGISPGPEMGRILEAIRVERIAGAIATREEALAFAREASATGG